MLVIFKCSVFCLTQQSCYELSLPVTEKSNPISRDIDRAHSKQMVQILKRCNAEIFEKEINHDPFYQVWPIECKQDTNCVFLSRYAPNKSFPYNADLYILLFRDCIVYLSSKRWWMLQRGLK